MQPDGLAPEPGRILAPRGGSAIAPPGATDGGFRAYANPNPPNPLMMLPPDWREPVAVLWTTNAHMLPSALAVCARLRLYAGQGLTTDDVETICRVLCEPARAATHQFAAQLLADLAGMADQALKRRKAAEQTARMREEGRAFAGRGLAGPGQLFPEFGVPGQDG